MKALAPSEHEEQVLIRRVVTVVAGVALLTIPLLEVTLGTEESWVGMARLAVLLATFAMLGRTRLRTAQVVGGAAALLWLITALSVSLVVRGVVAGTDAGVGLGSGALWLAAGMGPPLFLAVRLRRGVAAAMSALGALVALMVVAAGGRVTLLMTHPGVVEVLLATIAVVATTAIVAWLAGRSAEERERALVLREQQAAEMARLEEHRHRRALLFTRTAEELRGPMEELQAAVAPVRTDDAAAPADAFARIERLAQDLLERVVRQMDALVREAGAVAAAAREGDPLPTRLRDEPSRPPVVLSITVLVLAVVALDAWSLWSLGQTPVPDPHDVAAAANRMIVVLFLAAAVLVVRFPGPFGWTLTGIALLAHPIAVLGLDPVPRAALLVWAAQTWRIAALGAAMLAVLALIIERRVRDRDALVAEADDDRARSGRLLREERVAELTYAEATHELKNPLSVVSGAARLLATRRSDLGPERTTKLHGAMVHAADRLSARLAVMREAATSETEAGASRADGVPAAATDLLVDAVAAARPALGDRTIDVDLRVTGAWTSAAADDVEHVLENLLTNAHKYGDRGAAVRVTASRDEDRIVVEVANPGGMLTPEDAERMFEPYWRGANANGTAPGTGIGLALVARLVRGWGGRAWAVAEDGWTRVAFSMPVVGSVEAATWQDLEDQLT